MIEEIKIIKSIIYKIILIKVNNETLRSLIEIVCGLIYKLQMFNAVSFIYLF